MNHKLYLDRKDNMKRKTGLQLAVALGLVATSNLLTSCQKDFDYYNPEYVKQQYAQSWENNFGEIDEDQDWSMVTKAKVNYAVHLDGLETYKLQLFTENPLTSESTSLIANYEVTTDTKGNASISFDADVLKGVSLFYACYEDKYGNRYVKAVNLDNDELNITFGSADATASAAKRSIKRAKSTDGVSYDEVYNEVMARVGEAVEVTTTNAGQTWTDKQNTNYAQVMKISAGQNWTSGESGYLSSLSTTGEVLYVYGTLNITQNLSIGLNSLLVVCDGGTVNISKGATLSSYGDGGNTEPGRLIVLKGGKVSGEGNVAFYNGTKDKYNYVAADATMDIAMLSDNGGLFYNYGTLKVEQLKGASGNSVYVNNGNMTVEATGESWDHSATASMRVYNNCNLVSNGYFHCRDLYMGPSSYAEFKNDFSVSGSNDGINDASEVTMAANSYIHVDGGVSINNSNIVGPTEGYSVFEMGSVSYANYTEGAENLAYGYVINNIYISVDNPTYGSSIWDLTPYDKLEKIMIGGKLYRTDNNQVSYANKSDLGTGNTVIIEKGKSSIVIPSGDCGKGYEGNTEEGGEEYVYDEQTIIFACEDLGGTDDYDFNDIVFSVSHAAGSKYATVKALAAGGTYAATISYKTSENDSTLIGEIHQRLAGPAALTSIMLNTTTLDYVDAGVKIEVPEEWSIYENRSNFVITVNSNTVLTGYYLTQTISSAMEMGVAPQVILLPGDWEWPVERKRMTEAYPEFKNWSASSLSYDWIASKVSSNVVVR